MVNKLLVLQDQIKRDPASYKDEFQLQFRHYKACHGLFSLRPNNGSEDFARLVRFVAQVSDRYPNLTRGFGEEIMDLLEKNSMTVDHELRRSLVQSLILLRKRGQVAPMAALPLFFRMFHCRDKSLRVMLFKHIVADIKNANKKAKNESLNKRLRAFLYSVLQEPNEVTAKKSLAVLTELWRRQIWRDAHTVDVIATATEHPSSTVVLAAAKFFLGYDVNDAGGESDDEEEIDKLAQQQTAQEVYRAHHKGTTATKKHKIARLKKARTQVKKHLRKARAADPENFAALQLLNNPQRFAEKLFARVRAGRERFETRLTMIMVISRAIGIHKLIVLNFYPFLQNYMKPSQQDVTSILASLVHACHDLVPPDTLAPVVRHLANNYIHDRARPEVITTGLKTVREICVRAPLVMTQELLSDLEMYRKFKNKHVAAAAKGVICLFREIAPLMLRRKNRGRGANTDAVLESYGTVTPKARIEGAELLEDELGNGVQSDSEEEGQELEEESSGVEDGSPCEVEGSQGEGGMDDDESGSDLNASEAELELDSDEAKSCSEDEDDDGDCEDACTGCSGDEVESLDGNNESGSSPGELLSSPEDDSCKASKLSGQKRQREAEPDSLANLRRKLAAATAARHGEGNTTGNRAMQHGQPGGHGEEASVVDNGNSADVQKGMPIEMQRILDDSDFERMQELRHRQLVKAIMSKHGLVPVHRKKKLLEAAEEVVDQALALEAMRNSITEQRVAPDELVGKVKGKLAKEELLRSAAKGKEGREGFEAASKRKKKKSGGTSNREKQKRKNLPAAARLNQARRRRRKNDIKRKGKNFKGHVRK
ncbi:unnamed protein product [Ostreobium quekettii]|uniref:Protein SDA1 n=1 Tax=Ostreobium quekettii TaxID=121088 RepID=A0A8S1IX73_9CHLO|nr:unnamed protein product [Ostreobium quekettii]